MPIMRVLCQWYSPCPDKQACHVEPWRRMLESAHQPQACVNLGCGQWGHLIASQGPGWGRGDVPYPPSPARGLSKTCVYGHGEACKVGKRLQRHPLFKHTQGLKQKPKRRFPAKRMLVTALNPTLAQLLSQASIHRQHLTTAPNPARVSVVCPLDPSWDAIFRFIRSFQNFSWASHRTLISVSVANQLQTF
jgi:hypothetical protein